MLRIKLFDGRDQDLTVYNRQAVLDYAVEFFTEECDNDFIDEEVDFTFPSYASSYFRVFNERLGTRILNVPAARSGGSLILNVSALDMTFEVNGNYYYEIGYVQSGGYEIVLMYGILRAV